MTRSRRKRTGRPEVIALAQARSAGFTQKELAAQMGISVARLKRIERGIDRVTVSELMQATMIMFIYITAAELGVPFDMIAGEIMNEVEK